MSIIYTFYTTLCWKVNAGRGEKGETVKLAILYMCANEGASSFTVAAFMIYAWEHWKENPPM